MYSIVILTKFSRPLTRFCMYSVCSIFYNFTIHTRLCQILVDKAGEEILVVVPPWPQSHPTHFERLVDVRLHHCHHLLRWRGRLHHASTPPSSICCRCVLGFQCERTFLILRTFWAWCCDDLLRNSHSSKTLHKTIFLKKMASHLHSCLDENWDVQRFLCKNQFNIFLTK